MKKISLLLIGLLCLLISGCTITQKQFSHTLKTGRYISEEPFSYNDCDITYFELKLLEGNRMRYVKRNGKDMIKDLYTVNEKFYTVLDVKITMCINGENKDFAFENAKPLNYQTTTEYKISGLEYRDYKLNINYELFDSFTMTTIDEDGDSIAEKMQIKIGETSFIVENNDILYRITLIDEKGIIGRKGTVEYTYFDYQIVEWYIDDVHHFMYDGSFDYKYRIPIITLSDGEMLIPTPVKNDKGTSVDYWLFSFPMPSYDITGVVSEIEVDESAVINK